jgi:1-deoxy-D-xylulose-5-phosphate reductoisomerase
MKSLAILGSTGSVGKSTLDVIRENQDEFKIELLTARTNFRLMAEQCKEFTPKFVYLENKEAQKSFLDELGTNDSQVTLLSDEKELNQIIASQDLGIVVAAMVGIVGLKPVFQAIKHGKHILLANKESYVVAGEILNNLSKKTGATIFPIDSEHSAIHQCLMGVKNQESISRLILTGSGGPFLNRDINDFKNITPKEATSHPIWNMGDKISVDSSTMMNKCLEIIEAKWLFGFDNIDLLIHPEGIIHSLVEFKDKSLMAQLSIPDMKIPIAYGLGFPERINSGSDSLDFEKISSLSFVKPDSKKFPSLVLAKDCINSGGTSFSTLNAANEECVASFLEGRIGYLDIHKIISEVLDKSDIKMVEEIEDIFEADMQSREMTKELINTN